MLLHVKYKICCFSSKSLIDYNFHGKSKLYYFNSTNVQRFKDVQIIASAFLNVLLSFICKTIGCNFSFIALQHVLCFVLLFYIHLLFH